MEFLAKSVSLLKPSLDAAHRPLASFEASPYRARASPGEAAGREARKTFFKELCDEYGFMKIALAHTRNDRVETFLMNLLRGSGPEGLVSMAPAAGNIIRPLIEVGREDVEAYLKEQNQEWRTDSTNFDPVFARNRLRHIVLPELASKFNPNLIETLARTTEILEGEDVCMQTLTDQWLQEHGTREEDDFVIPASILESEPPAMIRRVLRTALRMAGSDLQDVSFDQIEAVRSLLNPGKSGKIVQIPGGMHVTREFNRLVVRRPAAALDYNYELKIPGFVHIPELGKVFRAEIVEREARARQGEAVEVVMDAANKGGPERVFVDAESIGPYVRIRNWNPGDYYRPVGLPGGKLKKLFQRARIPRGHRSRWPVIVAESTIVWVASFPVSREFVPREHSQKKVVFEALQS